MATLRQIKDKQQSVSTINKITKAMQLVSSAKSQKAVKEMRDYKDYFNKVQRIMSELVKEVKSEEKAYKGTYWILVMSDLGLAGGYNSNIIKTTLANLKPEDKIVVLGNKGMSFARKQEKKAEWYSINEILEGQLLAQIITRIHAAYYDEKMEVKVVYTEYISQMEFEPKLKQVLPIEPIELSEEEKIEVDSVIEFEPNKEDLLVQLEDLYLQSLIVGIYKEAQASEHTARKNAMENATNNGNELLQALSIEYNRGRQAKITQEISEIIGGAESIK